MENNTNGEILACVACRRCHAKCDRTMPKCTNCQRKGIECSYTRIPRKRGPNSENLVSVNAVHKMRDEIRKQKQLQAYWERQYNELLAKTADPAKNSTDDTRQGDFWTNPLVRQNLLRMVTKFDTNPLLKNAYLFKELLSQYIVDTFPFYEFRVPYLELDQFSNATDRMQRGLMFTMLANACSYLGNIKLFGELTQAAKAEVGLRFDTSDPIVTAMYFIMADSYIVIGDYEKCALAHTIASTSVKNLIRRSNGQDPTYEGINLNLVSKFSSTWVNMAINNEFQEPVETANELLNTWDKSISGASEYFWYMATLREVKIIAEMSILHLNGFTPTLEMVQNWLALVNQAAFVLHNTTMPRRSRQVGLLWIEATRAFVFLAANQRDSALQVCDYLIEETRDLELKNLMSIAPLAVIAGVYLFYLKYDKFNQLLGTLQSLAYAHPVARVIVMILKELAEVYMPVDSIGSLVRLLLHLFNKYTMTKSTANPTNNETEHQAHHIPAIFTTGIADNLPPVPEPHVESEYESRSFEDQISDQLSFEELHGNIWTNEVYMGDHNEFYNENTSSD